MKYNILMKYGSSAKSLWQYYTVTSASETDGTTTTALYETEDLVELEATLLKLYKKYPTDDIKVVSDVTATLDITFE